MDLIKIISVFKIKLVIYLFIIIFTIKIVEKKVITSKSVSKKFFVIFNAKLTNILLISHK